MVKQNRSLLIYIILSILTLGIYSFYNTYSIAKDTNTICEGDGEKTSGLFLYIVFTILTCGIYSFVWYYKIGNRLQANGDKYGLKIVENGTTLLVWQLLGSLLCGIGAFIALHILFKNLNALATAYNAKQ